MTPCKMQLKILDMIHKATSWRVRSSKKTGEESAHSKTGGWGL